MKGLFWLRGKKIKKAGGKKKLSSNIGSLISIFQNRRELQQKLGSSISSSIFKVVERDRERVERERERV